MRSLEQSTVIETRSRMVVARLWGRGERRGSCCFSGYRVSVSQDEKVLEIRYTTMLTQLMLLNCTAKNDYDSKSYMQFTTVKQLKGKKASHQGTLSVFKYFHFIVVLKVGTSSISRGFVRNAKFQAPFHLLNQKFWRCGAQGSVVEGAFRAILCS